MTGRRPRNPRAAAGSEAAFQDQVLGLARLYGWRGYHTHDSRRSSPGFPDLVLLRPPRLMFAELKTATGQLRREQDEWLNDLRQVGAVEVYLWRPDQLQAIAELLAGNGIDPEIGRAWAAERVQAVTPTVRAHRLTGGKDVHR